MGLAELRAWRNPVPRAEAEAGLQLALRLEGRLSAVRVELYSVARNALGAWELPLSPAEGGGWRRLRLPPLPLAAGLHHVRVRAGKRQATASILVLP